MIILVDIENVTLTFWRKLGLFLCGVWIAATWINPVKFISTMQIRVIFFFTVLEDTALWCNKFNMYWLPAYVVQFYEQYRYVTILIFVQLIISFTFIVLILKKGMSFFTWGILFWNINQKI